MKKTDFPTIDSTTIKFLYQNIKFRNLFSFILGLIYTAAFLNYIILYTIMCVNVIYMYMLYITHKYFIHPSILYLFYSIIFILYFWQNANNTLTTTRRDDEEKKRIWKYIQKFYFHILSRYENPKLHYYRLFSIIWYC